MLPQDFKDRMKEMLQDEYQPFLLSYEEDRYQSLRLNPLKTESEDFLEKAPFTLKKVPWTTYGYYYAKDDQPGRHPFHEAGVYYIQEPSAMAPVAYLAPEPGDIVLDLCAAPGGKSTQIGAALRGEGLLVCNEIHPTRAKILSENIERMGICNALVTNEAPATLARHFIAFFDRILVDAPCSGEGMFRKNETACAEWTKENVTLCANRQDEILDEAAVMLRPGGRMVYSTCTFAPEENEGSISRFLKRHPEFSIVPAEKQAGMSGGVPQWIEAPVEGLAHTIRLWPHKLHGEGHFLAVLQKAGSKIPGSERLSDKKEKGILPLSDKKQDYKSCLDFLREEIKIDFTGKLITFGEQLYLAPLSLPSLVGLKVLRPGLHLGTLKKNRFEPSHALALALRPNEVRLVADFSSKGQEIPFYLNGQTLSFSGEKGWYLISADGYSIGWGKLSGNILKNHYPKGLRKNHV